MPHYRDWITITAKKENNPALEITYTTNKTKNKDTYVKIGQNVFVFKFVTGEANLDDILDDYHWILESAKFK